MADAGTRPAWVLRLGPVDRMMGLRSESARRAERVNLAVLSLPELRAFLADPAALVRTRRARITVLAWQAPQFGWSGRLGPLPGVRKHEITLPRRGRGPAAVRVVLAEALSLRDIATAALAALTPTRQLPRPASADVASQGPAPWWLPPQPGHTAHAGPLPASDMIRPLDVVLSTDADTAAATEELVPAEAGTVLSAVPHGIEVAPRESLVVVDAGIVNPIGRSSPYGPETRTARLTFETGGPGQIWRMIADGDGRRGRKSRDLGGGTVAGPLAGDQLSTLRKLGTITCDGVPGEDPPEEAALLVQLAATGVVVHAPSLPEPVAGLLDTELQQIITAPLPGDDELEWEIRSVRQRSAALRGHGAAFALPRAAEAAFPSLAGPPLVSVVLVTRRPDYAAQALRYLDAQTYPELEIVLGLHGVELTEEIRDQLPYYRHPVEVVPVDGELSFGEALGAATGLTRGSLITKVDDDDIYGPEHVWDLVLAREFSGAVLVGKAAEFVHLETLGFTTRRQTTRAEAYGKYVAGGTMLISRGDLEELGGWRPVPKSVDRGLIDRVLRAGGMIYRTHPLGYVYERRASGHTWDPGAEFFLRPPGPQWSGLPPYPEFGAAGDQSTTASSGTPR